MAKANNTPKTTTDIPAEDIEAELAKLAPTATGRIGVSTNIEVEDRTEAPVDRSALNYEVEHSTLDNGIVLTTYGEVKAS